MIHLDEKQLILVKTILKQHLPNRKGVAFGSRVKGNPKPYSDLDLCIMGEPLSFEALAKLREDFSNSDLSVRIDIVEWEHLESQFQQIIDSCHELLS